MEKEGHYPNYYLKRKRLSRVKTVIVFRRNNLKEKDFIAEEELFLHEDKFSFNGMTGIFRIVVSGSSLQNMYGICKKDIKIRKFNDEISMFFRLPDQKDFPINFHDQVDCVEYWITCNGKRKIPYSDGKPRSFKSKARFHARPPYHRSYGESASSAQVGWSMSHPVQGGSCTPR